MNTTTISDYADDLRFDETTPIRRERVVNEPHLVVQILSVIAFGAFSIVGIALAFASFWLAGLVLAGVIAWTWAGSRTFGGRRNWPGPADMRSINDLAPAVSTQRSSGNASFDSYRTDMLQRLEQENRDFKNFLTRLRDARDATEFDKFMDDRALTARDAGSSDDQAQATA